MATHGALALLTFELTFLNFAQEQASVCLAWLRKMNSFHLEELKGGLVTDGYACYLLNFYYGPATMHAFLKIFKNLSR